MGRHPTVFDIRRRVRRRISLQISLWGSRPLNLNFFRPFFGPRIRFSAEKSIFWEGFRQVLLFWEGFRQVLCHPPHEGPPWGPMGPQGTPRGLMKPPLGPLGASWAPCWGQPLRACYTGYSARCFKFCSVPEPAERRHQSVSC